MSALETALHGLRSLIADGTLRANDRLPSEDVLAERLGVSRGSIREAIRMLAALGVIDTRHGSGNYLSKLRAADLIASLSLTVGLLPLSEVLELYELRRALEAHVASLAAARITDSVTQELSELLTELEASNDPQAQSELDHLFHMRIARIAGNDSLFSMLSVFRLRSRSYNLFLTEYAVEIKLHSDAGHRAILQALTTRDPVLASAAAASHVAQTEHWLRLVQPKVSRAR